MFRGVIATLALMVATSWSAMADNDERLYGELKEGTVCEVLVEYDCVTYGKTVSHTIYIKNCTTTPIALLDYTTTCRCTWLELPRKAIAPNEEGEVTITFDSRGEWGSVGNYLSIETSNKECEVAIWMGAEIIR